jgi:hypothetical protein
VARKSWTKALNFASASVMGAGVTVFWRPALGSVVAQATASRAGANAASRHHLFLTNDFNWLLCIPKIFRYPIPHPYHAARRALTGRGRATSFRASFRGPRGQFVEGVT